LRHGLLFLGDLHCLNREVRLLRAIEADHHSVELLTDLEALRALLVPVTAKVAALDESGHAIVANLDVEPGILDCPHDHGNRLALVDAAAGSALLANESLVAAIVEAVVRAVEVPVTLKIRTGTDPAHRNALAIARIAERAGIRALAVHGRTRACAYVGPIEYDTIRAVKQAVSIPVIANGDIATPEQAARVLAYTGADAIMIGRAAQGRPWIFREIGHYLECGTHLPPPTLAEARAAIAEHLDDHYQFYGEADGVRIARKHLGWYTKDLAGGDAFRREVNAVETAAAQLAAVHRFFDSLADTGERLEYRVGADIVDASIAFGWSGQASLRGGEALAA
jgi:tRNA-dihydrouridine synthase B